MQIFRFRSQDLGNEAFRLRSTLINFEYKRVVSPRARTASTGWLPSLSMASAQTGSPIAFQQLPPLPLIYCSENQMVHNILVDWSGLTVCQYNKLRFDQIDDPSCLLQNKPKYWGDCPPSLIHQYASLLKELSDWPISVNDTSTVWYCLQI